MSSTHTSTRDKIYILFFNACGFKESAYLLLNNPNRLSTDCNLFSVAIVNGMMSVELYLKFIMAYDSTLSNILCEAKFIRTHDIYVLFSKLSKHRQKEIRDMLKTFGCDARRFYKFRLQSRRASYNKQNLSAKNGDVVNWRYLLIERKNTYKFDINTMVQLNEALYQISQKIINRHYSKVILPNMSSPALDNVSKSIVDQLYTTPIRSVIE